MKTSEQSTSFVLSYRVAESGAPQALRRASETFSDACAALDRGEEIHGRRFLAQVRSDLIVALGELDALIEG